MTDRVGWSQTYDHGVPEAALLELPPEATTGTTVTFTPAPALCTPGEPRPSDRTAFGALRLIVDTADH